MSVDGNGRYCYLDPYRGAMLAVAEAARNVACAGARPLGATNCLNFGNPERPAIMWQFARAVEGIGEACRALGVPITGGNVSLYNETDGKAIYPTPVIGVVGLLEHADRVVGRRFQGAGDVIVLLGEGRGELGGSEYLKVVHGLVRGVPPALDLDAERALQELLVDARRRAAGSIGARLLGRRPRGDARRVLLRHRRHRRRGVDRRPSNGRSRCAASNDAAALFGESASRVVVSAPPDDVTEVLERAAAAGVPARVIGETGGNRLRIAVGGRDASIDAGRCDERRAARGRRAHRAGTSPRACGLKNMLDKFKDECGVFGIFGHPEAANMTYLGLYALQHRGQESAGIAASDGEQVRVSRAMGYVADIFDGETLSRAARAAGDRPRPLLDGRREQAGERPADPDRLRARPDCASATTATSSTRDELRDELVRQGSIFQSSSDTEVVLHLYARSKARERRGRDRRVGRRRCRARSRS